MGLKVNTGRGTEGSEINVEPSTSLLLSMRCMRKDKDWFSQKAGLHCILTFGLNLGLKTTVQ